MVAMLWCGGRRREGVHSARRRRRDFKGNKEANEMNAQMGWTRRVHLDYLDYLIHLDYIELKMPVGAFKSLEDRSYLVV